jgi:hypothetical protein
VSPIGDSQHPGPEPDQCGESQPFASNGLIFQISVPRPVVNSSTNFNLLEAHN